MFNINCKYNFDEIKKVKDIKYSGVHPFEKKKLINKMNTKIDNFNIYWGEKISPIINGTINLYTGKNRISNILKFMEKKNYPAMKPEELENALKIDNVVFTQDEAREIFNKLSSPSKEEFESCIKRITIDNPNDKLYEKIKKEGGKKIFKGGKIGEFDEFSKNLEEELGIKTDNNGKMNGIKFTSMLQSITEAVELLLDQKLAGIKRGGKKKLENFS